MRTLVPIAFLLLVFSSCSKYQYLDISSTNTRKAENGWFVVDNDSFRISYCFYGYDGLLRMNVTNRSQSMLEVDWSRSFIIRGGKPEPLFESGGFISGQLERDNSSRSTLINASLVQSSPLEFVPQGATISKTGPVIWPQKKLIDIKHRAMKKDRVNAAGFKKRVWKTGIKDTSSLSFRVYLTLNRAKESSPVVVDRSFYVTGLTEARVEPRAMPAHGEANIIVLRGPTRFNKMGFLVAGVVLLGGAIVASSTL